MEDTFSYRAKLPPVTDDTARPRWSVMIPTYNCAHFLQDTLAGVLAQDPGPEQMQIEVVDDASEDDPGSVVDKMSKGRVAFYRQPKNVGHVRNFETCLERSHGRLIHLLHGDDLVRKGFYQAMEEAFNRAPQIGAAFCRNVTINEQGLELSFSSVEQEQSGIWENALERLGVCQRIQTPAMVVRREVYEALGMFDRRLSWSEDWEMWVRIAAHYSIWFEVRPLAAYRIHQKSNTGRYTSSGEDIRDIGRALEIIRGYLPADRAGSIHRQSRLYHVRKYLDLANRAVKAGDKKVAGVQWRETMRSLVRWNTAPIDVWIKGLLVILRLLIRR